MKNYNEPKLEVIKLEKADVITTSGGGFAQLFSAGTLTKSSDRGLNLTGYRID